MSSITLRTVQTPAALTYPDGRAEKKDVEAEGRQTQKEWTAFQKASGTKVCTDEGILAMT